MGRCRAEPNLNKNIGVDTIERTTEQWDGKNLQKVFARRELTPMAKCEIKPTQSKHGRAEISTTIHP